MLSGEDVSLQEALEDRGTAYFSTNQRTTEENVWNVTALCEGVAVPDVATERKVMFNRMDIIKAAL